MSGIWSALLDHSDGGHAAWSDETTSRVVGLLIDTDTNDCMSWPDSGCYIDIYIPADRKNRTAANPETKDSHRDEKKDDGNNDSGNRS